MNKQIFEQLHATGLIDDPSLAAVKAAEDKRLFSLHWEIKTLLYLGVLLLSGGLGILVYENIDTIGHQVILLVIALICAGCFIYCFKQKSPFSWEQVQSPHAFFDYALLLGCLTFVTFIGYLQFQYTAFGTAYGLATFIPLLLLTFSAYYFDHLGVLSMAITNLAAWMGLTLTPLQLLSGNDFGNLFIIQTGFVLGLLLLCLGELSGRKKWKAHFAFTYQNFGAHIFYIACVSSMLLQEHLYLQWFLAIAVITWYLFRKAFREHSFYFILIAVLYTYLASCILLGRLLIILDNIEAIYAMLFYIIFSAIGVILLLVHLNKKIRHDRV
ncbi:DUF2157 domain-containing protein [Chitinophaga nivalis]|uniref:DUF2157 domain-containing protein n=1 Tax=Chitinophaga nivalis TaxID=2991709 RepID=A0ABT3IGK4_9BACT|nr:DUF2157 domain-containing protein [Chitinophaga nivalis]MCW3467358.1 DUF2157 domain-containing protein [Chitinophaga nivalis]MCW3482950.1 DUF2157 domain-containing protein [Chitinophaga nivalis]